MSCGGCRGLFMTSLGSRRRLLSGNEIRSFGEYGKLSVAIVGQQNRLAVELAVRTEGRIKAVRFTIQTKTVFDGNGLLGKACFMRLSRHQQVSWPLAVKAVKKQEKNLDAYRHRTAEPQA